MSKDKIIQMMSDAGLKPPARGDFIFIHWDQIAMLLNYEREACARECDKVSLRFFKDHDDLEQFGADECAAAIRSRGEI